MMSIILSACLIGDPSQCKDFKIPLDVRSDMGASECAMLAPPYFAQWNEEHPAWRIRRWKCQAGDVNDT